MAERLQLRISPNSTSCAPSQSTGRQSIAAIEERERQRTGISSLKGSL
jgi:hypothetical protein